MSEWDYIRCPRCNGKPYLLVEEGSTRVVCQDCGHRGKTLEVEGNLRYLDHLLAIEEWNNQKI